MAQRVQFRVVDAENLLTIHDVDESKGITTIGDDPDSDIVLKGPGAANVRLVLEYQQRPYRLTVPSQAEPVTVNGEAISPGDSCEIRDQDVIQVAGQTITFRVYGEEPVAPAVVPPPGAGPEPGLPPLPEVPPPAVVPDQGTVPTDVDAGPSILTSLPEQEQKWTIDVEQTVVLTLRVVNAGDLVAEFHVTAEGVPPEWVRIEPREFHLNERSDITVTIAITPPRLPTSQAGTYHLALVATSPDNYPNERSQAEADITVNPYYELAVGNLSPRRQSISWSQPSGQAKVPLTNRGNSEAWVALTGEDDARACRFEFADTKEKDEPLYLTRQVNLSLPFNQTLRVPVQLVPQRRPLIGRGGRLIDLRPRVHPYTITVMAPQSQQGPWTLTGEWENSPRFSRWVLLASALAMLLLLLACTYWAFHPGIYTSNFARPDSIRAGQVVELNWEARPRFLISFKLDGKSVNPPVILRPEETTTYELRADTWLSRFIPAWSATALDTVVVRPVRPDILFFEAEPERVTPGQRVVLSWVVDDAAELVLVDHGTGVQETLPSLCGSREVQVGQDTAYYTLRAMAADGTDVERVVSVQVGSPVISVFSAAPTAITSATDVTLIWRVLGTDVVTLDRKSLVSGGEFVVTSIPVKGSRGSVTQSVDSTTLFTLTAGSGATQTVETARVKVLKPVAIPDRAGTATPTQVPTAGPTDDRSKTLGSVIVYTALSKTELGERGLGATPTITLTEIPASFSGTEMTLDELKGFDYVLAPTDTLATNVLIVRESTEVLIRRLVAEKENPRADVIWMVAATGMIRLRAEGLLEPLAGVYEPPGLELIEAGWRDPTPPPEWLGLSAWVAGFCVNEERLPIVDGEPLVPQTWENLTDARYRDQIAMPSPNTSGTGYMVVSGLLRKSPYGEADGWAYLDQLHENIASYTSSGDQPCKMVADKNYPRVAIGIAANACADPMFVYPKEGAGWEMDAVALVRKDKVSADALHFVAWAISREAMEKYARIRPGLSYIGFEPTETCVEGFDADEMSPDRFLWASASFQRITEEWLSRYGSESDLIELEPGQ